MKIRAGYVSNSSSSSFVIHNWFDIDPDKREYIKDYDKNALEVWQRKKIKYRTDKDLYGYIQDFPFGGEEYYFDHQNNDNKKLKYDFGFINNSCRWEFVEDKEKNECIVDTFMDNFDMENWLKYNKLHYETIDRS